MDTPKSDKGRAAAAGHTSSKFELSWQSLLKEAKEQRAGMLKVGTEIRRYLHGKPSKKDKSKDKGSSSVSTNIPLLRKLIDNAVPQVAGATPVATVKPRDPNSPLWVGVAKAREAYLAKVAEQADLEEIMARCGYDAFIFGLAAAEIGWNPELDIAWVDHVPIEKCLWDCSAPGDPTLMRWAAVEFDIDTAAARKKWGAEWLDANVSSMDSGFSEGEPNASQWLPKSKKSSSETITRSRLVRIYVRGDDPNAYDTDIESFDLRIKKVNDDDGFSGENESIIFDPITGRVVSREPWDYALKIGQLPLVMVTPEIQQHSMVDVTPLGPFLPLQKHIGYGWGFAMSALHEMALTRGVYDNTIPAETVARLKQLKDQNWQGVTPEVMASIQSGGGFHKLPAHTVNDSFVEILNRLMGLFADTSQMADVSADSIAGISKTGVANIANERSQTRIGFIAKRFEKFASSIYDGVLMIAASVADGESIADWIGDGMMGDTRTMTQQTPMGPQERTVYFNYWPETPDPAQIRRLGSVEVRPGSMRRMSRQEQMQMETQMFEITNNIMDKYEQSLRERGKGLSTGARLRVYQQYAQNMAKLSGQPELAFNLISEDDIIDLPQMNSMGEEAQMLAAQAQMQQAQNQPAQSA